MLALESPSVMDAELIALQCAMPHRGSASSNASANGGATGRRITFSMSLLDFRTVLRDAGLLDRHRRALIKPDVIFVAVTGQHSLSKVCAHMDFELFAVALARVASVVYPELEAVDALRALSAEFLSASARDMAGRDGRAWDTVVPSLLEKAAKTTGHLGFDASMSEAELNAWLRERYMRERVVKNAADAGAVARTAAARQAAAVRGGQCVRCAVADLGAGGGSSGGS